MGFKAASLVRNYRQVISINDLRNKIIGIDALNIIYRFLHDSKIQNGVIEKDSKGNIIPHLPGILSLIDFFYKTGIKPLFVFDRGPPYFKSDPPKFHIDPKAVDTQRMLDLLGIPHITAISGEGEAELAYLNRKGIIYASYTGDYDALLYGAPKMIQEILVNQSKTTIIHLEKVLTGYKISHEQLVIAALLSGTDYNPRGIIGIGLMTGLEIARKYSSLEKVIDYVKRTYFPTEDKFHEAFPFDPKVIYDIFINPSTTGKTEFSWEDMKEDKLMTFLCDERELSEIEVKHMIEKLRNSGK